MRLSAIAASLLLAGCATHHGAAPGPAGIPYACGGGRAARVVYEGGGNLMRATARLLFDGRTIELEAVPTDRGLRYASRGDAALIWSAQGEEAWLRQADADGEREIAHCARVRTGGSDAGHAGEAGPRH